MPAECSQIIRFNPGQPEYNFKTRFDKLFKYAKNDLRRSKDDKLLQFRLKVLISQELQYTENSPLTLEAYAPQAERARAASGPWYGELLNKANVFTAAVLQKYDQIIDSLQAPATREGGARRSKKTSKQKAAGSYNIAVRRTYEADD
jgi:hypothetical protein